MVGSWSTVHTSTALHSTHLQRREAFQRETNRSITCTTAPQGFPTQRCAAHDCWRCLRLQEQQYLTLNDRRRACKSSRHTDTP